MGRGLIRQNSKLLTYYAPFSRQSGKIPDLQAVPYRARGNWIGPEPGIGSVRVLFRVLNYPGSGSKFGYREPGYPLTSLIKFQYATIDIVNSTLRVIL